MFETVAFYFFSIATLAMFSISVFSKNVLNAMTALAGGMIFIAGFFFLLNADFLGVVQIIVYTGAVMVLYAFAIMFFDAQKEVKEKKESIIYLMMIFIAVLLVVIVCAPIISTKIISQYPIIKELDNAEIIGIAIFTKYLVVFELVAIMLLVAMICAIVLVHKDMQKANQ